MFQAALFFGDLVGAFGLTYLLTRLVDWCSRKWGGDDGDPPGGWRWRRRPRPDEGRGPGPRSPHRMVGGGRTPRRSVR
jgi:hypothetical protein